MVDVSHVNRPHHTPVIHPPNYPQAAPLQAAKETLLFGIFSTTNKESG